MSSAPRGARTLLAMAGVTATSILSAQQPAATPPSPPTSSETDEEIVVLSPFEVSAAAKNGYAAASTLAGNRLNTELRDIGSSVSVVTGEFLKDTGATDNKTLLQYTTGSEVGGSFGNFAGNGDGPLLDESSKFINPNANTRVRGLAAADNTRDFYLTSVPWDGYNVDAVDLQRGPNSILFGMGSPAGIINTRTKQASFKNSGEVSARLSSYGSNRETLDVNRVLIKDQLAFRFDALRNDEKYKQDPAFSKDERIYGAVRYEPAFLKKDGRRTILKANYEAGRITSNNPRTMPPIDLITPWFYTGTYQGTVQGQPYTFTNLNRQTFNATQLTDDNTGRPNHGQIRPSINGGPDAGKPNPAFNPWVGNFAQQFGGPLVFFNGDNSAITGSWVLEPGVFKGGLAANGTIDNTVGGMPWQRPGGIAKYADFAQSAGLKYSNFGVYKDILLNDASIFDYYNKLLDGPNKKEWQNFRNYNISLAQTFMDDQLGFELAYNNEFYRNGQLSLLTGANQAIYIDINNVYSDGTPTGANGEPFSDGTKNPNVGRAYLSDNGQGNNNSYLSKKEVKRATLFATHDFEKDAKNLFTKIMGKHTVTVLFANDEDETESRSWIRYTADDASIAKRTTGTPRQITDNYAVPNTVIYLGDSLLNRTSASGANLPNPTAAQIVLPHTVWNFDATWNKSTDPTSPNYVDPNAQWINEYYPDIPAFNDLTAKNHPRITTQSENPANYVGWTQQPINWIDSEASAENRAHNLTSIAKRKSFVSSDALVWQGKFWNNAIVGTYGVRKDIAKSWSDSLDSNTVYGEDPSTRGVIPAAHYPQIKDKWNNRIQMTSHSWMIVGHLNQLLGLDQFMKKSPIEVSLYYNKSTNFQPAAQRVDMYNNPLAPPSGKTVERGILLETKDGKYSLKATKYETSSVNVSNDTLNGSLWFLGASQTWGGNWCNNFEYNWINTNTIDGAVKPADLDPNNSQYNYGIAPGETLADAQAREAAAIAGWRAWQQQLASTPYYQAWKLDLTTPFRTTGATGLNATQPNGLAVTEDSLSKGYEFEFNGQITSAWRVTANASRTTAERNNVGGAALSDFVSRYETALNTTKAGDMRVWWGGAGNETTKFQWNQRFGSTYHMLKLLEGTNVPELRKWRFNLVNNYDFRSGFMKGVNVGGGVRYESSIIIGYPVIDGAVSTQVFYDLQNPYKGKGETNFDFWVGYSHTVWRNVEWNIQLNVRNAFVGNELVALTTQPDGTPAGYRIRPPQTWQLTNTFRF